MSLPRSGRPRAGFENDFTIGHASGMPDDRLRSFPQCISTSIWKNIEAVLRKGNALVVFTLPFQLVDGSPDISLFCLDTPYSYSIIVSSEDANT